LRLLIASFQKHRRAKIIDAGAETYSRILPWLFLYGYTKLEGINIVFTDRKRLGPIIYKHGDVTFTDYAPKTFDAIACLSVVEHGVDLSAYFKEAARILKPGGILITSTDYWQTPIDTRGRQMYGVPVHIFGSSGNRVGGFEGS
jgi:SAM-dependent methyltransferase